MAGLWTLYGRQWTLYGRRWGLYLSADAEVVRQPGGFIPDTIYLDEKNRPVSKKRKPAKTPAPVTVTSGEADLPHSAPDLTPIVAKSMADMASLISKEMRAALAQMQRDDDLALILLMAA